MVESLAIGLLFEAVSSPRAEAVFFLFSSAFPRFGGAPDTQQVLDACGRVTNPFFYANQHARLHSGFLFFLPPYAMSSSIVPPLRCVLNLPSRGTLHSSLIIVIINNIIIVTIYWMLTMFQVLRQTP